MFGLKQDWVVEAPARHFVLEDYEGATARWCPGCGDHAVLIAMQRLCRDEQLPPEKTMVVSGIGCSSRFPHYMKTYGFHGLHGRALPVACGIRSRRPDLHMFVITGDGDCCSIGAGHWLHAIRYNMRMPVLLFDNRIYGLTKAQTSPTSVLGQRTNTHPQGAFLPPIDPISTVLGLTNASFVAQTVDWNPVHLYNTLKVAYHHPGTAFVRIFQRCPHFTPEAFEPYQQDPSMVLLMEHPEGVAADDSLRRIFKNRVEHDPSDLAEARELARHQDVLPIGLFYRNAKAPRYDELSSRGLGMPRREKLAAIDKAMNRFAI